LAFVDSSTSPSLTIVVSHPHSSSSSFTCASFSSLTPPLPHASPIPIICTSHHPAAYEVPNDNTIAKLAAGYEFSAEDDACDTAWDKFNDCADNLPESKAYFEALEKAGAACKSEADAAGKACPEDDTSYDEAACNAADAKLDTCLTPFGLDDKATAWYEAKLASADAACKSGADAIEKACPEDDDQGEDDQGDSPQM
jgi:hypothetical protein